MDSVSGAVEVQKTPGTYFLPGGVVQEIVSVNEGGNYIFEIFDQAGNGICCDNGFGEASVFLGNSANPGQLLAYTDGRYLDHLQVPFRASSAGFSFVQSPGVGLFLVRFQTDLFPFQSSLEIRTLDGDFVWFVNLEEHVFPTELLTYIIELNLGQSYRFSVFDDGSDGWCKLRTWQQACRSILEFVLSPFL